GLRERRSVSGERGPVVGSAALGGGLAGALVADGGAGSAASGSAWRVAVAGCGGVGVGSQRSGAGTDAGDRVEPERVAGRVVRGSGDGGDALFAATADVVAVGLRRVQNSGFVDAFVVGLDAGSGAVLWTRHLVSTADTGGAGTLPVANPMVSSGGRLFVDNGLGVVASLDPRSGDLHWLRVLTPE
ncbi:unnamed protein product, partial [Ectocarpus fasciculatus]